MTLYSALNYHDELPIYKKAEEIFVLSKHIGKYMSEDLTGLQEDGSEDSHVYVSGDIIQQSESLGTEILKANQEILPEVKYKRVSRLSRLISRMVSSCSRLETSKSNGRDFLPILKSELIKLKKMQQHWILTL